ncbi:O-antigen polymerase [Pseudoalteromonas fuliginea]|uniref:O-antigen polymerase n=1 Tax=Pseudoalteromonas fuliginea TaxID=1872678 RepID=UPI000517F667|nr:O-antigen polymerase [Pseudoalteromonas fuliginea]KJZ27707.1 hypothetical protein TW82_10680 [Pseudoalteromonas fuliginea]
MKIKKKINGHILFSPNVFLIFCAFFFSICIIENPLGWSNAFGWDGTINYDLVFIYLLSLYLGIKLGGINFFPSKVSLDEKNNINYKYLALLFFIAIIFQSAKFINIGDIPLLGDPLSRYNLTLGGFEDYPTRLIAPFCMIFSLFYIDNKRLKYIIFIFLGVILNLFFLQRQEVMNLILGVALVLTFRKKINFNTIIKVILVAFIVAYIFIGVAAVVRVGPDALMTNANVFILPLWVIHADTTTAFLFGQSVVEKMNGEYLYGKYSFGIFISIFIPGYTEHGAELVRVMFTEAKTAQSISVPYSYYVDFGYTSLFFLSFLQGFVLSYFYRKAINSMSYSDLVLYAVIYLNALWSLRSGSVILSPIVIYIIFSFYCLSNTSEKKITFRNLARGGFVFILAISTIALAFRI